MVQRELVDAKSSPLADTQRNLAKVLPYFVGKSRFFRDAGGSKRYSQAQSGPKQPLRGREAQTVQADRL